ncbi:hypothetical protein [Nocardioides sp.]|uniref:hypothetical protein n=1 Tax=Nocardioides sp. TaxID=35761 RepID=UPI002718011C|nr:hypothetical protein [Nocardioides sp.]MDO9457661.1 hypothetical protein [Nocardioides sp.]
MAHLIFGSRWNNGFSMMLDAMSEDDARARYEQGLEVSIACGVEELAAEPPDDLDFEGEQPAEWELYTELSRHERRPDQPGVAIVEFYNFWGTRVAAHYFYRQDDGRLFLAQVDELDFTDTSRFVEDNEWAVLTEHSFSPDGTSSVVVRTTQPDGRTDVTMSEHAGGDFASHWEPVPAWGDWASITRRDRSQPA